MKCNIVITGQVSGNFTLLSLLNTYVSKKGMFNSFYIQYDSVKDAKKAMNNAYKELKNHAKEVNGSLPNLSTDKARLSYDASQVIITKEKINYER